MVDRFGLVGRMTLSKLGMILLFFGICFSRRVGGSDGGHIVGTQVKRPENIQADLAVETKSLETDCRDFIARFVQGANLKKTRLEFPRMEGSATSGHAGGCTDGGSWASHCAGARCCRGRRKRVKRAKEADGAIIRQMRYGQELEVMYISDGKLD